MAPSLSHLKQWNPDISKILNEGAGDMAKDSGSCRNGSNPGHFWEEALRARFRPSLFLCHETAVTQTATVLSACSPERRQHGAEPQLIHNGYVTCVRKTPLLFFSAF